MQAAYDASHSLKKGAKKVIAIMILRLATLFIGLWISPKVTWQILSDEEFDHLIITTWAICWTMFIATFWTIS